MEGRDVRGACVAEFAIDLVGVEKQVVFFDDVAQKIHFAAGVEIAGGVVGVADKDSFGAGGDQFLELFDGRERKAVLDGRWDGHDLGSGRDCERHVVGVGRFRHDVAMRQQPFRRAVFQSLAVDMFKCVEPDGRSWYVGLPDIEVIDLYAPLFCGVSQRNEFSYG